LFFFKCLNKARNYRYLGGRYGKSTEREIMEEIKANGPVILNFEPVYAFMYYKSGIYHSTDAADWIEEHGEKP
jgi:cathepsin C